MDYINEIFSMSFLSAAGWTVLHSLWMGIALLTVILIAQHVGAKDSPSRKYRIAFVGQATLFILAILTFTFYYLRPESATLGEVMFSGEMESFGVVQTSFVNEWKNVLAANAPSIAMIWMIGMTFLLLKMLIGFRYIHNLRKSSWRITDERLIELVTIIKSKFKLNISCDIRSTNKFLSPLLTGLYRPFILLPLAVINSLSMEEVELVLAHELAHLKRYDHIAVFFQQIFETVLYFNPAIWILSRQLNKYREEACDDLVVQVMGKEVNYAKSLVKLQELQILRRQEGFVLSALGRKNHLLNRIKRIMKMETNNRFNLGRLSILFLLPLTFALLSFYSKQDRNNNRNTEVEVEKIAHLVSHVEYDHSMTQIDTVPVPKSRTKIIEKITKKENGREVEAEFEGDEIKYLKIDGALADPSNTEEYDEIIADLRDDLADNSNQRNNTNSFFFKGGDEDIEIEMEFEELGEEMEELFEHLGEDMGELFEDFGENMEGLFDDIEVKELENGFMLKLDGDDVFEFYGNGENDNFNFNFNGDTENLKKYFENFNSNHPEMLEYFENYQSHFPEIIEEDGNIIIRKYNDGDDVIIFRDDIARWTEDAQRLAEEYEHNAERWALEWKDRAKEMKERQKEMKKHWKDRAKERRGHEGNVMRVYPQWRDRNDNSDVHVHRLLELAQRDNSISLQHRIEKELKNDGFMSAGGNYTFKLKENKLRINGKKQPQDIYEKYKDIYERYTGSDLSGSTYSTSNTGI